MGSRSAVRHGLAEQVSITASIMTLIGSQRERYETESFATNALRAQVAWHCCPSGCHAALGAALGGELLAGGVAINADAVCVRYGVCGTARRNSVAFYLHGGLVLIAGEVVRPCAVRWRWRRTRGHASPSPWQGRDAGVVRGLWGCGSGLGPAMRRAFINVVVCSSCLGQHW